MQRNNQTTPNTLPGLFSSANQAFTPYTERAFGFLDVWNEGEWAFKVYGINRRPEHEPGHLINPLTVTAARSHIQTQLPILNLQEDHHHTGFVVIHQALGGNWLMLHWWEQEVICCQELWESSEKTPADFVTAPAHFVACVWELVVIDFERRTWVDTMLRPESNREAYLATRLPDGSH